MYLPKSFEETRPEVLHALLRAHPLATLVTLTSSGLFATHLPMILEEGVLRGHVSRANTQWTTTDTAVEALAIFSGPQHYITPAWYPEKQATGKVVPTWNYATVHAYGTFRAVEDTAWLRAHVEALTNTHESKRERPWKISDAPADYIDSQLRGIVGVEIAITRLEGKWKMSQNRNEADREGVVAGLAADGTPSAETVSALVAERLRG